MITYRAYLQEIEHFNDQNMLDQVIAHAGYLLENFPGSFEAARLLGQAYLEEKKYPESAKYLQKVLACIPDDFVAHVGLSATKEEKGEIDAALYHMELAFDTQPSNTIVQAELKRLIEKSGGGKPLKINLSKGALIRMYIKGELYQQALNEADAALAAYPDRIDLQLLKAVAYFRSSQKVQAAEICSKILEKLPYCYEANKILFEIYLEKGLQEPASQARERLASLNPYYRYVASTGMAVADIPDSKVEIEKFDYTPAFLPANERAIGAPSTSPFTVDLSTMEATYPQKMGASIEAKPQDTTATLPDFLSQAGWEKSDHPVEEVVPVEAEPKPKNDAPIAKAKLPDWLQNFQVSEEFSEKKAPSDQSEFLKESDKVQDNDDTIFSNIDSALMDNSVSKSEVEMPSDTPQSPFPNDESSNWMSQFFDESNKNASQPEGEKELPDWLKSFSPSEADAEKEKDAKEELPDWLKSIDATATAAQEETDPSTLPEQPAEGDAPDWLRSLESANSQEAPVESMENQDNSLSDVAPIPDESPVAPEIPGELSSYENDFLKSLDGLKEANDNPLSNDSPMMGETPPQEAPTESESALPDWVKSVLSTPDAVPSAEDNGVEAETPLPPEPEEVLPQAVAAPATEGAISKETGDELLDWLRDISPDGEPAPVSEEPEVFLEQHEEVAQPVDNSAERLAETLGSAAAVEAITQEPAEEETPQPAPVPADEPEELTEATPESSEAVAETNLLDRLISMIETGNYDDIPALLAEMGAKNYAVNDILEALNSFRAERSNDFTYLQMLGDALASYDRYDEALEVYSMAEKLFK